MSGCASRARTCGRLLAQARNNHLRAPHADGTRARRLNARRCGPHGGNPNRYARSNITNPWRQIKEACPLARTNRQTDPRANHRIAEQAITGGAHQYPDARLRPLQGQRVLLSRAGWFGPMSAERVSSGICLCEGSEKYPQARFRIRLRLKTTDSDLRVTVLETRAVFRRQFVWTFQSYLVNTPPCCSGDLPV